MIRKSLSLRTQLMLLLGALVIVATASLGSIAYNSSRANIEVGAVREVGITANARKQALLRVLTQQSVRAAALLKTASLGCAPEETWCLRKVLADFVATGGATAVRLFYRRHASIAVGKDAAELATVAGPAPNQVARFDFDDKGQPFYVIVASALTEDGEMVVTLRGDMEVVDEIFRDRYGLGQSGETFLTDAKGRFLTAPRYQTSAGGERPFGGEVMQVCLAGSSGEVLDQDYRGVAVIHGFRHLGEIGGGCVMAQIDQAEAFAPANALRKRVAGLFVLLAALAIACSFLFAQLLSRPMYKLRDRARSLQAGDFDSPVPMRGPAEVRMFAQTFEAMARSLKDSRTALRKSTEQIGNILESISEGFCAFDREWRCTYVNEKATVLSQIPREQLLGKKLWELIPGDVNPTVQRELHRAMNDKVPVQLEEYYAPFDTWFQVNAFPTRDGLALFGRDVTEQRRFNERIQQTQKLESLGVLAGGIAHDFNNLLTGIIGNASLALEELPPDSPLQSGLQDVVNAAGRAAALTQQLLAYAGKGRLVAQPLDLSEVVGEISTLIQTSIPRSVGLHLHLRDHLPIQGDAAQIQQLVMNLVINGAEAIGEGKPGMVVVTTELQEVDETYIQQTFGPDGISPGKYVVLEVTDTGCGMDEATISRIFDPFFTTKFAGRGLGLSAAMGIVRGHKGALKVHSVVGRGSSFKVLLPVSKGEAIERLQAGGEKNLGGTGTILVIEDEDLVRRAAASTLEHYGYKVIVAENGQVGVDLFGKLAETISLVLLDVTMPVMSGEEAFNRLRSIRPNVPVILSSGYSEVDATRRFTGKGLAGFIQKPYTAAHLAEQVKSALAASAPGPPGSAGGE